MNTITTSTIADIYIEKEIVFVKYHKKAKINLESSIQLMIDRENVCDGKSYPVVTDASQVLYWTSASRQFMAGRENNKFIKSTAIIISSSIHKIIVEYYIKVNNPSVPTQFFLSAQEGIQWLRK